ADNIKRAIQRGTGELEGVNYEEITFEGYGPGGVALLVEVTTDNRNRTVSDIRHTFTKGGGNLGEAGSVSWMFHKKGQIVVPKSAAKEDDLMNIVLETGGDDLNDDGDNWEILTAPNVFEGVLDAVKKAGIEVLHSSLGMVPQNYIKLEGPAASQMIRLLEALEDQDDVQNVYSNFDVDQKQLEEVAGEFRGRFDLIKAFQKGPPFGFIGDLIISPDRSLRRSPNALTSPGSLRVPVSPWWIFSLTH